MAAGVCLIFLIPYFAESRESTDEDVNILDKKANIDTQNNGKQDSDLELIKSQKSHAVIGSNSRSESDLFSRRSRYCIFPCLPTRSRSGIEEGKYCNEKEEQESNHIGNKTNLDRVEKMSVI